MAPFLYFYFTHVLDVKGRGRGAALARQTLARGTRVLFSKSTAAKSVTGKENDSTVVKGAAR